MISNEIVEKVSVVSLLRSDFHLAYYISEFLGSHALVSSRHFFLYNVLFLLA
jgi:hypothetical protein